MTALYRLWPHLFWRASIVRSFLIQNQSWILSRTKTALRLLYDLSFFLLYTKMLYEEEKIQLMSTKNSTKIYFPIKRNSYSILIVSFTFVSIRHNTFVIFKIKIIQEFCKYSRLKYFQTKRKTNIVCLIVLKS